MGILPQSERERLAFRKRLSIVLQNAPRKILVIRDDRIGDLVLATPVCEALRKKFPESAVTVLASTSAGEILRHNPSVNAVIERSEAAGRIFSKAFWKLVRRVASEHFHLAVILKPSWHTAFLTTFAKIPLRIGTGYRPYSGLFNRRIYVHRKDSTRHELEYNFDVLQPLGITYQGEVPKIFLNEAERERGRTLLEPLRQAESSLVVIHPGGGGGSARFWPVGHFAQLSDRLVEAGYRVVLTGSKADRPVVSEYLGAVRLGPFRLDEKTILRELAAAYAACNLVITNSTGPMHIAAAVGTPVIAFFCPIRTASPRRWGPRGVSHRVLLPLVTECTCAVNRCERGNCMAQITVEQAFASAVSVLTSLSRR